MKTETKQSIAWILVVLGSVVFALGVFTIALWDIWHSAGYIDNISKTISLRISHMALVAILAGVMLTCFAVFGVVENGKRIKCKRQYRLGGLLNKWAATLYYSLEVIMFAGNHVPDPPKTGSYVRIPDCLEKIADSIEYYLSFPEAKVKIKQNDALRDVLDIIRQAVAIYRDPPGGTRALDAERVLNNALKKLEPLL